MKTCPTCRVRYPDSLEFCPQDGAALPGGTPGRTQHLYDRFVGTVVDGRYKIESKLGEGGMGFVYAARHVIIDKRVAIKVLKKEAQQDETAAQRFIQEARSASKIGHANIVDITDFGQMPDGSAYFVMEFLEGVTLGHVIDQGPLPPLRAIRIAAQAARGLQAAHKHSIVHRDLKPDNIFLIERDGQTDVVKIVDFGIAKVQTEGNRDRRLTAAGMVLGTPEYMSPEQATGKEADHRVDQYALGCILYEMLTGDVPFRGTNSAATLTKHVFEEVEPPRNRRPDLAIPERLEAIVLKMLAKNPEDRYPAMLQVLDALDEAGVALGADRAGVRTAVRPAIGVTVRVPPTPPPPANRNWTTYGAVAAAVVLVFGVGGFLVLGRGGKRSSALPDPAAVAANPTAQPAVPEHAAPPPKPEAPEAVFSFRTSPPGAEVFAADRRVGVTPFDYRLPRSSDPVEFTFRLAGYKDLSRTLIPDGRYEVEMTLVAQPPRSGASRSRAASGARSLPAPRKTRSVSDLRDPFD